MTKAKAAEIIAHALELERGRRLLLIRKYANEGHLHVTDEGHHYDELWVSVQGHIFKCKRDNWPSIEFTAQVSLAIAAGLSDRNETLDRDEAEPHTPWRSRNLDRAIKGNHDRALPYRGGKSIIVNWMEEAKELP